MRTSALCLIVLGAGCASAPLLPLSVEHAHLLSGCKQTPLEGGVIYKCSEFMLSVIRSTPSIPTRALLALHLHDLERAVGGKFVEHPSVFTSWDSKQEAIEYSLLSREEGERPIATGILTTLARRPEGTWLVSCMASTSTRTPEICTQLLLEIAKRGLPERKLPAPSNILAGRPLGIPPTCQVLFGNRIRCENAELSWDELSAREVMQLDTKVIPNIKADLATLGDIKGHQIACKIENANTECLVFEIRPSSGKKMTVVMGVAKIRKRPYVVQCAFDERSAKDVPPPCNQVIRVD